MCLMLVFPSIFTLSQKGLEPLVRNPLIPAMFAQRRWQSRWKEEGIETLGNVSKMMRNKKETKLSACSYKTDIQRGTTYIVHTYTIMDCALDVSLFLKPKPPRTVEAQKQGAKKKRTKHKKSSGVEG